MGSDTRLDNSTGGLEGGQTRRLGRPGRVYLIALAAGLVLYVVSVAPGPLWQDSGMAQARVLRHDLRGELGLALSHPLYYALASAFQVLPLGESALKTNLVSAVFGAVTVANVCLLLALTTRRYGPAAIGGISLAVAHTFWQHCALAEVYTVSTALLTAELLCLNRYCETGKGRWLSLLLLSNGLGVSNHMLAILHLPVWGVLLLWLLWRRKIGGWALLAAGGAWLVGASTYLGLITSAITAGQPASSAIQSALFGSHYQGSVANFTPSAKLLKNTVLYLGLNFPTPNALLALAGCAALRRLKPRPLAAALGVMLAVHLLWAIRYDVPDQYTFFIPAIVLIAVMIGLGAARLARRARRVRLPFLLLLALLPVAVYVPLPRLARAAGLALGVNRQVPYRDEYEYFLWPWKTRYDGPSRFAHEVRASLPDGAVLIADGTTVPPLHYLMLTGGWHKDTLVWPRLADDSGPAEYWPNESRIAMQLEAGLVYVVSPVRRYCPAWLLDHWTTVPDGVVHRVVGRRPTSAATVGR